MIILNTYLQELFGLFAPSGDKISDPIINKMNENLLKVYKSCDSKDDNKKQLCINEKMLEIKKETRAELIRGISNCEGRRSCHKIIAKHTSNLSTEISKLQNEISRLKRSK